MTVYEVEIRRDTCDGRVLEFYITASYARAQKELDTAEERNIGVIVTSYELKDAEELK